MVDHGWADQGCSLICTFNQGVVHAARLHARTQLGDMLYMLHVPWSA